MQPDINWACYCSAFTQQSEILEVTASSQVFHTQAGGGQSEIYSLFSLQSTLLPVNQKLQPVTQLALWWLHCQLLGILKKTKTNYMRATVTYQILLQVHQAIGQLSWRTCQYIRDLLHLFPNHPLKQRILSYSNDNTFHPTEHPLPLLPYPSQVELFVQWRKNKKLKPTDCQDTPFSQCTCKWPLVQQHLSVNRTVGTTQARTQQSSKGTTRISTCT